MRLTFSDCLIDPETRRFSRGGEAIDLEPQVFDLVELLARNSERVVTRDEIVDVVWQGRIVSESAISARIAAARRAVGDDGKRQAVIRTVARRGLQMVAEVIGAETAPATTPDAPALQTSQRIRYTKDPDGRSIAYAITGAGPPLFRLGHNCTHLEAEWHCPCEREIFDRLSARHSLLRYDPVGFGMSDRDITEIDFTVMADNALRVADAAGIDRFAAYSESGGVHVAVRLAARHPDRVSKLVISGGYVDGRAARGDVPVPATFHTLIAEGWSIPDSPFAGAFLYPYFPEGPLDAVQDMARVMQRGADPDLLLQLRDAIDTVSNRSVAGDVKCPVLLIHASDDRVHPVSEARKMASLIPDAQLFIQNSANHMPLFGNPHFDTYIDALLDFFAE